MLIFWIIIFLIFSALFSGSEIAFISANKLNIELKKKRGGRRGRVISHFYDKPSRFLGAMLIGNNIALVVFTALMTIPLDEFFISRFGLEQGSASLLLLNTIIITIVVLIFGEFLPKAFFSVVRCRSALPAGHSIEDIPIPDEYPYPYDDTTDQFFIEKYSEKRA
jgi:putative hemolysin